MKLSKLALVATVACGTFVGNVFADQTKDISLVSHCAPACDCDCGEPVCGCEPCCEEEAACCDNACCEPECCDTACCDNACCDSGCDACGCDSGGCGLLGGMSMGSCMPGCGKCCLGDPYRLCDDDIYGWTLGGWFQMGYHSRANSLFNSFPDNFQLHQAWVYAEKAIDTRCGFDIGGRADIMYGTDSQDTQAFGTGQRGWDNGWDNGANYGGAAPQLYLEAGYGDLSVIMGKFYTIIGYEVVTAPDNFFYSHAYTMYNSEPFTHTGFLAKYEPNDRLTFWGGYSFGLDSGFDNNGDSFLGGISLGVTDDLTVTYATHAGRVLEPWSGVTPLPVTGYQHSIVADYAVTDSLNYIFQSDVLTFDATDNPFGITDVFDTVGINQYLIKTINDCWAVGTRFEWWNVETLGAGSDDVFAWTVGVNYRPHANLIMRPELRWDWDSDRVAGLQNNAASQTTFGVDTILTF